MSRIIIKSNPKEKRIPREGVHKIKIAEFFSRTLQGESASIGTPAAFLRTKDCTLNCSWCDSVSVWRYGNSYTVEEVLDLMEEHELVNDLRIGHHLVLTGGSPLKQQESLSILLAMFQIRYNFIPYIEVENEVVLEIQPRFSQFVAQWNHSPKLENSGMKRELRYKPEIIKQAAQMQNAWFKFVISNPLDWEEIKRDYLDPQLIDRRQIILMPCGEDQKTLAMSRPIVADIAIRENVLFSDRLHVTLWDQKTGV